MRQWSNVVSGVRPLLNAFKPGETSSAENLHAIHAVLSRYDCFSDFEELEDMCDFQDSGNTREDMDVANAILEVMWNYADEERIWIK